MLKIIISGSLSVKVFSDELFLLCRAHWICACDMQSNQNFWLCIINMKSHVIRVTPDWSHQIGHLLYVIKKWRQRKQEMQIRISLFYPTMSVNYSV